MSGLLAYYTFDDQNCNDALNEEDFHGIVQGKGNEMSFVRDTPTASGYALKGSNGGKWYKILRAPEKNQTVITYSCWIKTKATNSIWYGTEKSNASSLNGCCLGIGNGYVQVFYHIGSSFNNRYFSTDVSSILADGKWHHLTVVLKGGNNLLYIDGRYYETGSSYWDHSDHIYSYLGNGDGIMDNLRIYNRALTHDEVKELYRAKQ